MIKNHAKGMDGEPGNDGGRQCCVQQEMGCVLPAMGGEVCLGYVIIVEGSWECVLLVD